MWNLEKDGLQHQKTIPVPLRKNKNVSQITVSPKFENRKSLDFSCNFEMMPSKFDINKKACLVSMV